MVLQNQLGIAQEYSATGEFRFKEYFPPTHTLPHASGSLSCSVRHQACGPRCSQLLSPWGVLVMLW